MSQEPARHDLAYGGVLAEMRAYPVLVALCVILLTAAGIAIGAMRDPTYTASSRLLVGNLSIGDPSALPGAVGASQALAPVYARLIDATKVREQVAEETAERAEADVSATQIVETPMIEVTAESESEQAAIDYANAAGRALADYVSGLKSPGSEVGSLAERYREAQLDYREKLDVYNRLKADAGDSLSSPERAQLNEAESDMQTAKLERNAIGALYNRGQNIRASQPNLNMFELATDADSDRTETMQITGAIGLIAGLALGGALAVLLVSLRARRGS